MATKQAGWHLLQTHLIRPAERCGATARGNGYGVLKAEAVSFEYPLLSTGIRDSARSALPRTIAGSKGVCVSAGSDGQTVRAARNQSLYREVNERIKELNERFDEASGLGAEWICECLDPECREEMQLSFGEYEQLRTHPNQFVVLPGHVEKAVERIVEEHENYVVVAKLGPGAICAVEHDPREPERAV